MMLSTITHALTSLTTRTPQIHAIVDFPNLVETSQVITPVTSDADDGYNG
jgi:hypothetical protein